MVEINSKNLVITRDGMVESDQTIYRDSQQLLELINESYQNIFSASSFIELGWILYNQLKELMDAEIFFFALYNHENSKIDYLLSVDEGVEYKIDSVSLNDNLTSYVINNKSSLLINRSSDDNNDIDLYATSQKFGDLSKSSNSILLIPILNNSDAIGVLSVQSYKSDSYSEYLKQLAEFIANLAAQKILQLKIQEKLDSEKSKYLNILHEVEALKIRKEKLEVIINLVRAISHQLNQPLTGITCYSSFLIEELKEDQEFYQEIHDIGEQAGKLDQLIQKLQSLTRFESTKHSDIQEDCK